MERRQGKRKWILAIMCAVILILAILGVFIGLQVLKLTRYQKQVDIGNKYLAEMDYKKAERSYENAIGLVPDRPRAYVHLVHLYVAQKDYIKAIEVLEHSEAKLDPVWTAEAKKEIEREQDVSEVIKGQETEPKKEPEPTKMPEEAVTYDFRVETLSAGDYVKISYPVITSNKKSDAVDKINQILKTHAQKEAEENQEALNLEDIPSIEEGMGYRVNCESVYLADGIASILFNSFWYAGGPHGYTKAVSMNFDLDTGEELLVGLLLDTTDKEVWNRVTTEYLSKMTGIENITEDIIRKGEESAAIWKVPGGCKVRMQQYALGSYALGMPEIFLPDEKAAGKVLDMTQIPLGIEKKELETMLGVSLQKSLYNGGDHENKLTQFHQYTAETASELHFPGVPMKLRFYFEGERLVCSSFSVNYWYYEDVSNSQNNDFLQECNKKFGVEAQVLENSSDSWYYWNKGSASGGFATGSLMRYAEWDSTYDTAFRSILELS